jgi:hypothetical protein
MRRILIDFARSRGHLKRGGAVAHISLDLTEEMITQRQSRSGEILRSRPAHADLVLGRP